MASKAKRKPFSYRDQRSATKDDINIGLRIRMKRVELDMSQQELGKTLGVSFQQVQKYEKGTNRISGNRLREVCIALQVDPNYLLGWEGKSLKLEDAQVKDSMTLRMAQAVNLLPVKVRTPVHSLIRSLGELSPSDLKS